MPRKPKLACLPPRLATANLSKVRGAMPEDRRTAHQRGYGHKWRVARIEYLRSHPMCVMCLARGRKTIATVVDHIVPHKGDEKLFWDRRNWQSLCAPCHSSHKQAQEKADGY